MTHLPKIDMRKAMREIILLPYAKGTRSLCKDRRDLRRNLEEEADDRKKAIIRKGIELLDQEITLRKRRLAQWKSDPEGVPEDIFASVNEV